MKTLPLTAITLIMALLAGCNEAANNESTESKAVKTETTQATTPPSTEATATETPKEEAKTGEQLHTENCTRCHGNEVYTRADRNVSSLDALASRVKACDANIGSQLFPEDLDKITTYLNESFYKF
jgi:mono/diheme cytochrome c family protein